MPMHEILFRGKQVDGGEWVHGSLVKMGPVDYTHYYILPDYASAFYTIEVGPKTVGQYTGLTDKNGVKIFEGDIVVCRRETNGNFIDCLVEIRIEFGYVEMAYGAFGLHRKQGYYRPLKDWLEDYEYEVIGNIHDNPELLEGGGV